MRFTHLPASLAGGMPAPTRPGLPPLAAGPSPAARPLTPGRPVTPTHAQRPAQPGVGLRDVTPSLIGVARHYPTVQGGAACACSAGCATCRGSDQLPTGAASPGLRGGLGMETQSHVSGPVAWRPDLVPEFAARCGRFVIPGGGGVSERKAPCGNPLGVCWHDDLCGRGECDPGKHCWKVRLWGTNPLTGLPDESRASRWVHICSAHRPTFAEVWKAVTADSFNPRGRPLPPVGSPSVTYDVDLTARYRPPGLPTPRFEVVLCAGDVEEGLPPFPRPPAF